MADLPTLYNSLVDTFKAIARVTELESDEKSRKITQAIRINIPDEADDLAEGSTAMERIEESGAYALASQAMRIATEAYDEATAPELLPEDAYAPIFAVITAEITGGYSFAEVVRAGNGEGGVGAAPDGWTLVSGGLTGTAYEASNRPNLGFGGVVILSAHDVVISEVESTEYTFERAFPFTIATEGKVFIAGSVTDGNHWDIDYPFYPESEAP